MRSGWQFDQRVESPVGKLEQAGVIRGGEDGFIARDGMDALHASQPDEEAEEDCRRDEDGVIG